MSDENPTKEELEEAIRTSEFKAQELSMTYKHLAVLQSLRNINLAISSLDRALTLWPENLEAVEFRQSLVDTKEGV